jgi:phenylacetate-CoA ligase
MIKDFLNKVYGSGVVCASLRGQRNIPYLSEEELWSLRDARLRQIVKYAAETVPYYQNLFRKEGIDPQSIKTVHDLRRIPLVEKPTIRRNPSLFISTSRRGKSSIAFTTSGSTGEPSTIQHDYDSLLANIAYGERERSVLSTMCGKRFGLREAYIVRPRSTIIKVWEYYQKHTFASSSRPRLLLDVLQPIEQIVDAINTFRPDILVGYGSYLEALFRTLRFKGTQMHLPRVLFYGAECMTDPGKAFIEMEFSVPVLSMYNAVEAFKIGFLCEARHGFHLHDDLCHVRIMSANDVDVPAGAKGQVVISNLVNRGTVLLNYRLGDVASLATGKCSCGRISPMLSELEGRVEDIIFLTDGGFVHPRAVWAVLSQRNQVLKYQLIQHQPERFELRLVTVDYQSYQLVVGAIHADLRRLLGESAVIDSEYYTALEPEASGKFRPVMSKCKQGLPV